MRVDVGSLASEFPNDNPALHSGVIWVCLEPTGPARPERVMRAIASAPLAAIEEVDGAGEDAGPIVIVVEELDPIEVEVEGIAVAEAIAEAEPVTLAAPEPMLVMEAEPVTVLAPEPILIVEAEPEPEPVTVEAEPLAIAEAEPVTVAEAEPVTVAEAEPVTVEAPLAEALPVFDEVAANDVSRPTTDLPPAPDDPFTVLVCTLADVAIGAGAPHVAAMLPGLLFDGRLPDGAAPELVAALSAAGVVDGAQVGASFIGTAGAWREILRGTSDDFSACGSSMLDEWASDLLARLLGAPASSLLQELRTRGVAAFGLIEAAA